MSRKGEMVFTDTCHHDNNTSEVMKNREAMGLPPAYTTYDPISLCDMAMPERTVVIPPPSQSSLSAQSSTNFRISPQRNDPDLPNTSTTRQVDRLNALVNASATRMEHCINTNLLGNVPTPNAISINSPSCETNSSNNDNNSNTLNSRPCRNVCPHCRREAIKIIRHEYTWRTHTIAAVLCIFGFCCCGCIMPYLFNYGRKAYQHCGSCNTKLETFF